MISIAVQPPRSTRSSSLVTLSRPSTSSSLRITDRSFHYASPRLWNQLPAPLRQPRTNLSNSASPSCMSGTSSIGSIDSPLSSSITPSTRSSKSIIHDQPCMNDTTIINWPGFILFFANFCFPATALGKLFAPCDQAVGLYQGGGDALRLGRWP